MMEFEMPEAKMEVHAKGRYRMLDENGPIIYGLDEQARSYIDDTTRRSCS